MSQKSEPNIYLYGADHSPWTQAVIMFLEYKQLKYTLNTTPDFKSIKHNKCNVSYFQMPVLHYNNQIISDSVKILKFINARHLKPAVYSYNITAEDQMNLNRIFMHAITRTKSRLFDFIYKWSLIKDNPTSYMSLFFRPVIVVYFAMLITVASHGKVQNMANVFKINTQIEDMNAYYPEKTFIYGLKYFENQKQYLYSSEKQLPSLLDFLLLGQFQCLHTGLSNECLPLVDEYFPSSKQWLKLMHENVLPKYDRFYTKCEVIGTNVFERLIFWLGFVLGLPMHVSIALIVLMLRGPPPKSKL
eukprot:532869_1